jgi:hypothetical protein
MHGTTVKITSSGFLWYFPMRAISHACIIPLDWIKQIIVGEVHKRWYLLLRNFVHPSVSLRGPVGQKTNVQSV